MCKNDALVSGTLLRPIRILYPFAEKKKKTHLCHSTGYQFMNKCNEPVIKRNKHVFFFFSLMVRTFKQMRTKRLYTCPVLSITIDLILTNSTKNI